MDEDGVPQAFCPLLWRANGGAFDNKGVPLKGEDPVRGYCTRPYDCADCEHMQQELSFHPPDQVWWICPRCVAQLKSRRNQRGRHLLLPGYYTEGCCQNPLCKREGESKNSPFLQLVIGDIRKESG